jgi:hypothetical protein
MRKKPEEKERLKRDLPPLPAHVRRRRPEKEAEEPERPEHDPLVHFMGQAKAFLLKNGLHIALVGGLIIVGIVTYKIVSIGQSTRTLSQWETISNLPQVAAVLYPPENFATLRDISIQQCQAVLDSRPSAAIAPWVLLKLADLYAFGDQWPAAEETYKRLIAQYPGSPASEWAKPALAVTLEQMGKYTDAAALYESLAEGARPLYLADAGRCRELSGDVPGAEADYRKLLDSKVPEAASNEVKARLVALAQGKPLTAPPLLQLPKKAAAAAPELMVVPAETPAARAATPAAPPKTPMVPAPAKPAAEQPKTQ